MKSSIYFKKVPDIDDLFLEQILFSYENIPVVFVCIDKSKSRYLCVCDDMIDEESWIIARISDSKLLEVLNDESTVLSAFKNKKVIMADRKGNCEPEYTVIEYNSIDEDELPVCDQLLEMKDYLDAYIESVRNDVLSVNYEQQFDFDSTTDGELNISEIQSISEEKTRAELYEELLENGSDMTENASDNSFSMKISCSAENKDTGNLNNYSKDNIAFAA